MRPTARSAPLAGRHTVRGMRPILIVDDHPDQCVALVKLFRFAGIDARLVPDGREALAAVTERRPDVILLDVMMPDMDGFQVLRACVR